MTLANNMYLCVVNLLKYYFINLFKKHCIMNKMKWMVLFMSITMIFSGCASMNNTGKGAAIGGGSGAALGAILGGVIGKGKGAAIGAAIGTAVGAGTGALIGKKMDKAAAEAKQIEGAQVEQITDNNGLQAVKVTFDSGILFTTGNATLSAAAKSALSKFANNVLNQNRDMDVSIYGYTDNQGWRNSTAEQSIQKNLNLSQERAQSVDQKCAGNGRKRSYRQQRHSCRKRTESSCRSLHVRK